MKKMKKIMAAAIAMMTFSTAAAVTGTVAWFTANNIVSASGMQIKAEAEEGIVISNEGKSDWKDSILATHDGSVTGASPAAYYSYIPTATVAASDWYHANASDANNYAAKGTPVVFAATKNSDGVGVIDLNQHVTGASTTNNKNIYLLNSFYVQASAQTDLTGQDLFVSYLNVTGNSSSPELDRALRILFKVDSTVKCYCPLRTTDFTATTYACAAAHAVTSTESTVAAADTLVSNGTIKAYTSDGANATQVDVYLFFCGEDEDCKSANIKATLDSLSVEFKLENRDHH